MEMKLTLAEARENGVKSGLIKIVADGYNAPVTAGERADFSTGCLLPSMLCCPFRQLHAASLGFAPCVLGAGGQLAVRQAAAVQLKAWLYSACSLQGSMCDPPCTSAGNFVDLVTKNFYDGMDIQRADGFVVQTGKPADVSTLAASQCWLCACCWAHSAALLSWLLCAAGSRRPAGPTLAAAFCWAALKALLQHHL